MNMIYPKVRNVYRSTQKTGPRPNSKPVILPYFKIIKTQKGSALIMAAILTVVATMLIVLGTKLLVTARQQTKQQTLSVAEAENAARAGLVDAINWYRRQTSNYVTALLAAPSTVINSPTYTYVDDAFKPSQTASPPDTLDATIGIVQQYPINGAVSALAGAGNIWARYEVRRQKDPSTNPVDPMAVHDISGERVITNPPTVNGRGYVWSLYSFGYIYNNVNPAVPYNQFPNKVLASAQMSTEIRKLSLFIPTTAAAMVPGGMCSIVVKSNGQIVGGSGGYACAAPATAAGCPSVSGTGIISAGLIPASVAAAATTLISGADPSGIFGLSLPEIQNLADFRGDSVSTPLTISSSDKLSYFNGNLTYSPTNPVSVYQNQYLNTVRTGVLYVDGNFTLAAVSGSQTGAFFNGVVFVNGAVTIGEGNSIYGCVMATNGITVGTNAGGSVGKATLAYSAGVITREIQQVAVYREDKSSAHNFTGVPNL